MTPVERVAELRELLRDCAFWMGQEPIHSAGDEQKLQALLKRIANVTQPAEIEEASRAR